jgi:hypothetical protein
MRTLLQIAKDATATPQLTDWRYYSNKIIQLFHDQPKVIRKLATYVDEQGLDGKTVYEAPTAEDIDRPDYAMEPKTDHTALVGDVITARMPQIYQSVALSKDKWKQAFAGNARLPRVISQLIRKVKIEEDLIGFQGSTKENTPGLIDSNNTSTDLGNPTGAWDTDTGNNGILNYAQADIGKALDDFVANGLGDLPVDIVITSYAYNLLKNYDMPNRNSTNLKLVQDKLNGGKIYPTNNLQTGVTADLNSFLAIARGSGEESGWMIISSGLEQEEWKEGPWHIGYAVREKFRVKLLDNDYVRWMDGIDTTS